MSSDDKKPIIDSPMKSSMEILSELFSSFDAAPPLIIKKEKDDSKKHKKSKKKHKHKDKKHKKKDKKHKKRNSSSDRSDEFDLAGVNIKQEATTPEPLVKLETVIKEEPVNLEKKSDSDQKIPVPITNQDKEKEKEKTKPDKIVIKNLKFSSIFEATIKEIKEKQDKDKSDGEVSDVADGEETRVVRKRKRHHKHCSSEEKIKKHKRHHSSEKNRSRSGSRKRDREDSEFYKPKHEHKSRSLERDKEKDYKYSQYKYRERDHSRDFRSSDQDDYRDRERSKRYRENPFYREHEIENRKESDDRWASRNRYKRHDDYDREREKRYRDRSETRDSSYIDKKKLLEIARKNAIQMMKSGSLPGALTLGPHAQEKVIAAIKAGGKTIEELTDFCKTLSKKEETGDLSSLSEDGGSDTDNEKPFHHPFQIKDRPTSITMNIKNSVPLPIKSTQERTVELRMQFPVSSGQQHRKTENEWVPVAPKKSDVQPVKLPQPAPLSNVEAVAVPSLEPPPLPPALEVPTASVAATATPGPQVFPDAPTEANIDIGHIVSQRLSAIRKLQENPNDVQAISEMYKAQKKMQTWAESKQQPGQFTGSTGAQILSQAELSSGYQAWARKDQLQTAAPVSGGMGMHLLQKMGWKPGEGLGKEKRGTLEPLLLEVKLDKKGLVANEEQKKKPVKSQKVTVQTLEGKHPVSLLGEYASKRKLGAPQYQVCFECGPDHKKNFLFKVILNGMEYKPNVASPNKKEAKANAARVCLQQLGLLPS